MKMKCTFMTHLYWIVLLPDCLKHSVLVNLFSWFRSSTWRPSSEPRSQRSTLTCASSFQIRCGSESTRLLEQEAGFCTHFLKIWSIGQYQQEVRPWWTFYPFQMYQTLPSSAVLPHYLETCHCGSECPTPKSSLSSLWKWGAHLCAHFGLVCRNGQRAWTAVIQRKPRTA